MIGKPIPGDMVTNGTYDAEYVGEVVNTFEVGSAKGAHVLRIPNASRRRNGFKVGSLFAVSDGAFFRNWSIIKTVPELVAEYTDKVSRICSTRIAVEDIEGLLDEFAAKVQEAQR